LVVHFALGPKTAPQQKRVNELIPNPIATAMKAAPEHRAETVAFAVYASYAILTKQLLAMAEDPATPTALKKAIVAPTGRRAP
jgi:hypothetical protein